MVKKWSIGAIRIQLDPFVVQYMLLALVKSQAIVDQSSIILLFNATTDKVEPELIFANDQRTTTQSRY
jgi:hypothetical protein